ncbi:MAG: transcriptional regulator [Comamonadaceae bacterium SCN 68-20]|jgi:predicted transcriptional regulator YdeE|nr:MAG: transcriptional regulator [Comamonadaceae bacterium SCN 68-20]OJX29045.1 MAG: AraC family transcriptional regulator [Burkholderiales bacterium 68-20]UJB66124.1 GyrI-like domain-containing protein [Acidovorax sp. YS12]
MAPSVVHVPAFSVMGVAVRTCNRDEMLPERARIGALWDRFFSESWAHRLPGPGAEGHLYGVYSAYASDQHGAFDVTAGVPAAAQAEPPAQAVRVEVQAGDYLVFLGEGPMPQMVIDAWAAVWRYFEAHPEARRRFGTDFERYEGPERVALHIGIESGRG